MKTVFAGIFNISANRHGFTLIEILVTIIISAVLAVILGQVVSSQTARSYAPLQLLDGNLALRAAMENIQADYTRLRTQPAFLPELKQNIATKDQYWKDDPGKDIIIQAVFNDCVALAAIESEIPAECTEPNSMLKVTLKVQGSRQRLTALFAP